MSIVSSMRGPAQRAGASVRALARKTPLAALALGVAALLCTPGEAKADSDQEWLRAAFAKTPSMHAFGPPQRLGVDPPNTERRRRGRSRNVRTASLGAIPAPSLPSSEAAGGHGTRWAANAQCLAPSLRAIIAHVSANYGRVRVNSTCRSRKHNRRVGGAPRSYHLSGNAADFRIFGNVRATLAYLRSTVGGLKHYGGGLFHIDTGPRRRM